MEILFVTEADSLIGTGHLNRSISIAEVFRENLHKVHFYLRSSNSQSLALLSRHKFYVCSAITNPQNGGQKHQLSSKIAFIDLLGPGFGYEIDLLKELGYLICLIDDADPIRLKNSDMHFMMPTTFRDESYKGVEFNGWDLIPLRHDVVKQLKNPVSFAKQKYIVVTFGGSDPGELTELFCGHFQILDIAEDVVIICGPNVTNSRVERINSMVSGISNATVLHNPDNFVELCSGASMGIVAFGISFYEFLFYEIPTITIYRNVSEVNLLFPLSDSLGTIFLSEDNFRHTLGSGIANSVLNSKAKLVSEMSANAEGMYVISLRPDGRGSQNIYKCVMDYIAKFNRFDLEPRT